MKSSEVQRTLHVQHGKFVVKGTYARGCRAMSRSTCARHDEIFFGAPSLPGAACHRGAQRKNQKRKNSKIAKIKNCNSQKFKRGNIDLVNVFRAQRTPFWGNLRFKALIRTECD